MKKFFSVCIFFLSFILFSLPAFAGKKSPSNSLQNQIDQLLNQFGENINIGIVVLNPKTGQLLYKKNADRYFSPASNQKLFTAYAALNYLQPSFTYITDLFIDATKIQNGILNDNVYLKFSGDPTLTFLQLQRLISRLAQAGVQRINGNIIVDDNAFDQVTMSPGTSWDDRNFCFGSPISSLILDHNCVYATLAPAKSPNQPAILTLPTQPQFMHIINDTVTRSPTENCRIDAKLINEYTYVISGCVKTTDTPKKLSFAVYNPRLNLQYALIYLLDQNKIANNRIVEFRKIVASPTPFASESSPALQKLITIMLKKSDNTISNALFKTIGSFYAQAPGTWENGHDALHDIFVKSMQLDMPKATLIDGAGASRYNFVTPLHITTLLYKIFKSKDAAFFISALPISGTDGTLKLRMTSKDLNGKIHAKTGSEKAIVTLAGYLETDKKNTLIFVIMINGFVDSSHKYTELEDKICATLIKSA